MTCGGRAPRDYSARIESNRLLGEKTGLLTVLCPAIAASAEPGQFVMVRPGGGDDPFLGRPLAVAFVSGRTFTLVYRVVGKGTALLAKRRAGDELTVRGPIGQGFFSSREGLPLPEKVILAGGAVGAAPLLFALQRLGGRAERTVMGVAGSGWEDFASWLMEVFPALELYSDDGTLGIKGTVLSGLPEELPGNTEVWACGPEGMLRALAAKYPSDGGRIRVALEARMACGMGGCLGCVIPTRSGQKRVCVDGPVFAASEVLWNEFPSR
ncbi:MAG: dihydroorotate dehydrogenase electron transfer subunit [Synergistaceae bacterium]|nr:dihydroorotate dehydrogenase electron transfer subunit [Synergistaceae bacterium]